MAPRNSSKYFRCCLWKGPHQKKCINSLKLSSIGKSISQAMFLVGCRPLFVRLAEHLEFRFALGAKQWLPGRGQPFAFRPGIVGTRGSMITRLRPCMTSSTPPPIPPSMCLSSSSTHALPPIPYPSAEHFPARSESGFGMAPPPPPPAPVRSSTMVGRGETPRRSVGGRMKDPSPVGGGALFGTPTPSQVRLFFCPHSLHFSCLCVYVYY